MNWFTLFGWIKSRVRYDRILSGTFLFNQLHCATLCESITETADFSLSFSSSSSSFDARIYSMIKKRWLDRTRPCRSCLFLARTWWTHISIVVICSSEGKPLENEKWPTTGKWRRAFVIATALGRSQAESQQQVHSYAIHIFRKNSCGVCN